MTRHVCSKTDRRAYWNYVRFCLAAQCSPMSALHWMLSTEKSVDWQVHRWRLWECSKNPIALEVRETSDHHLPWAKKARTHRPDSVMLAHIGELNRQGARPGWTIGVLGSDGLVHPEKLVRSQTRPKGGGLLQRLCRSCQTLLPPNRFSHNGKPAGRNTCKRCDNSKRIARRKLKTAGRREQVSPGDGEQPKALFRCCHGGIALFYFLTAQCRSRRTAAITEKENDMTHDVDAIVERLTALRELTRETGTVTTKTQNQILQSLPNDVLAEVALRLKRAAVLNTALGGGR